MNVRSEPRSQGQKAKALTAAAAIPQGNGQYDYADIELPGTAKSSDFDMATIAILASIVVFKLLMLSVLIVAF